MPFDPNSAKKAGRKSKRGPAKKEVGTSEKLITYVTDRPGHDFRYAIDSSKINIELGWKPSLQFEEGIKKTVAWYLENQEWLEKIISRKS